MDTRDWIGLSVIFYVAVAAATAWYAFWVRRASVFEPIGQYLAFVSLFALPLPVRALITMDIEGNVSPFLPEFAPYLPLALVLTALAFPVFAVGYYSAFARRLGERVPMLADGGVRGTGWGAITLVVVSALLIYLLTEEIGGLLEFLLLGYKSTEATFGRGYLAVGFPWLIVAMVLFLERYKIGGWWIDLLAFLALLGANLAIHIVTGNRAMLMYMAIVTVVFLNFRIRKLSLPWLVPVALAGFVALNVIGALRNSNYDSLGDFFEKSLTSAERVGVDDNEGLFYTLTIGEFVVPFETLPQLIRTIGVTDWPWVGLTFLRAPVYLVPGAIYADRPLALGNWYMERFYGGGHGLNEGRAFFFLAEGYLNFGPIGVAFVAAAWGLLWGALHRWMVLGRERFGTVLVYALLVGFMFRCIAGELTTLLVGTTQQSLAAVALVLLVARLFGKKRVAHLRVDPA